MTMASGVWEVQMDSLVNQLARELSEAIAVAVSQDARVEACREKARASGLELRVSLEAAIGFVPREGNAVMRPAQKKSAARGPLDMSANDRRFLKSLRISAEEAAEKEVE
jgi:hypothetical protein